MLEDLLRIYEQSKTNPREPKCLFAETDLFNEGWLLKGVLGKWRSWNQQSSFPFLPFPEGTVIRASSQLYTAFKKRKRHEDKTGEHNTRADAIAGHFSRDSSKSGMRFMQGGNFFAAFEGKMYSGFSKIKNSNYSQLARTAACLIHAASKVPTSADSRFYLVTLFPADSKKISLAKHTKDSLEAEIKERICEYESDGEMEGCFGRTLESIWKQFHVCWVHWEDVVDEIADPDLRAFYQLCKRFGKAKPNDVVEGVTAAADRPIRTHQ